MTSVGQAAKHLGQQFDEVSRIVAEIDGKVDALIFGDFSTACAALDDAQSLSGVQRLNYLQDARRLFEASSGRIGHLLENKRQNFRSRLPKQYGLMANQKDRDYLRAAGLYLALNKHYSYEQPWLLSRIGALRVAHAIGDTELIKVKRDAVKSATLDTLDFITRKESEASSKRSVASSVGDKLLAVNSFLSPGGIYGNTVASLAAKKFLGQPKEIMEEERDNIQAKKNHLSEISDSFADDAFLSIETGRS